MIVRLHNLSARPPGLADEKAITKLMNMCDCAISGSGTVEEVIGKTWRAADFHLKTDAWVIVTEKGEIVGYADVRRDEHGRLISVVSVHPGYRGRGIGTLLTWLVEERARQIADGMQLHGRVSLSRTVSSRDIPARRLLEREGYTVVRRFWRVAIDINTVPDQSYQKPTRQDQLKVDLVVDAQDSLEMVDILSSSKSADTYIAHPYDVYEKELRAGMGQHIGTVMVSRT